MPPRGDPRRDDDMRRAAFAYALGIEDQMLRRCLFSALAFLPLLAPPARAADKAWEDCGQTADQDRKIAGCTEVLARGAAESATNRANAYVNRGYAYGTRDYDRAIKDYDEAIRVDPKLCVAITLAPVHIS